METVSNDKTPNLDLLFQEVGQYRDSRDYTKLFLFLVRFPWLSPYNAMLLHIQKPGSVFVATAKKWKMKFNRTIKPGARPLVILVPFGPVQFVFEISDTEGLEGTVPEEILQPFKAEGYISDKQLGCLRDNLIRWGINYYEADRGSMLAGSLRKDRNNKIERVYTRGKVSSIKTFFTMEINQNLSNAEKYATISHELGHLFCGHLGVPEEYGHLWPKKRGTLCHNIKEFEAESVAWLVCERVGIKNPSAAYLNGYLSENNQIPNISLESVLKAAGMIEALVERNVTIPKGLLV